MFSTSSRNAHVMSAELTHATIVPGQLVAISVDPRSSLCRLARDPVAVRQARAMRPRRVAALVNVIQRDADYRPIWIEVMLVGTHDDTQVGASGLHKVHLVDNLYVFPLKRLTLRVHAIHTGPAEFSHPKLLRAKLALARYRAWSVAINPRSLSDSSTEIIEGNSNALMASCAQAYQQEMNMQLVAEEHDMDQGGDSIEPRVHVWWDFRAEEITNPLNLRDDIEALWQIQSDKIERDQWQAAYGDSESGPEFKHNSSDTVEASFLQISPQSPVLLSHPVQARWRTWLRRGRMNKPRFGNVKVADTQKSEHNPHIQSPSYVFQPTELKPIENSDDSDDGHVQATDSASTSNETSLSKVEFNGMRTGQTPATAAKKLVWWRGISQS